MAFVEDLSVFTNPSEFGSAATLNGDAVNGIFDAAYISPLGVESVGPAFLCASADVPAVVHGQAFVVNATTYAVCGVEPDGTGMTLLRLERQ